MKKITTILILFVSVISFGQEKEYDSALKTYKNKKYAEAIPVLENFLNNEYGNITPSHREIIAELQLKISDAKNIGVSKEEVLSLNTGNVASETAINKTSNANTNRQDDKSNVSITVSGSGKTLDDAKQSALRSAIEQAYGTFISAKTEIFNDQVVADQISSVASGNIQSYAMLNESQLPNGTWGVTLKALVSISKLKSFVQAKGIAIEIKGGLFALNIKQQILNEQGEINAVTEMVGLLHEPMQTSFDYEIKNGEPKSLDAESKNWEIPLVVTAIANKNMDFCANYCIKTLAAISLTAAEVESYKTLNKVVLPVIITYDGQAQTFYLRKKTSINALTTLIAQWEFYVRGFSVQSGMDQLEGDLLRKGYWLWTPPVGEGKGQLHNFDTTKYPFTTTSISFLTTSNVAGVFSINDKRTLAQIEKMTGYAVKSTAVRSQFKHGGIVVYEQDGHGLVVALGDIGVFNWANSKTACDELILNGYDDWHLPTKDELNTISVNLLSKNIGGLRLANIKDIYTGNRYYWSSSEGGYYNEEAWCQKPTVTYYGASVPFIAKKNKTFNVRPVRSF